MNPDTASRGARMLAWLVVVLAAVFIVLGAVWYGFSPEVHQRFWRDILDRPSGPMSFRFFLQPSMAAIAAIHDGIKDARLGRSPYFWTILSNPAERGGRLREGLISTARIILLGFGMDAIYQYKVLNTFYPGEALLMALLLAVIPYFLIRGPVDRSARWWFARTKSNPKRRNRRLVEMEHITSKSEPDRISVELSARRTGMSFQRTRMSADRTLMSVIRTSLSLIGFGFTIFQFFQKLRETDVLTGGAGAARNFGIALVSLGIAMLMIGIIYQVQFMLGLRETRQEMTEAGLVHGESRFPPSLTLITAVILLFIGVAAIVSMVFHVGPFG